MSWLNLSITSWNASSSFSFCGTFWQKLRPTQHSIYWALMTLCPALMWSGCETDHWLRTWYLFVRASLHMRRDEKPSKCHWMVYCTYNMLSMFRVLLFPSSGVRDYMCVISAYGVRCRGCWRSGAGQPAMRQRWGMLIETSNLRQPATKASRTLGGNNTHIVSSSWWWA